MFTACIHTVIMYILLALPISSIKDSSPSRAEVHTIITYMGSSIINAEDPQTLHMSLQRSILQGNCNLENSKIIYNKKPKKSCEACRLKKRKCDGAKGKICSACLKSAKRQRIRPHCFYLPQFQAKIVPKDSSDHASMNATITSLSPESMISFTNGSPALSLQLPFQNNFNNCSPFSPYLGHEQSFLQPSISPDTTARRIQSDLENMQFETPCSPPYSDLSEMSGGSEKYDQFWSWILSPIEGEKTEDVSASAHRIVNYNWTLYNPHLAMIPN